MTLLLNEILTATRGKHIYGEFREFKGVSIDSRTINDGELFIALKGLNFDGHSFVNSALRKGNGAIVSIPPAEPPKGKTIICVVNTLKALQDIAHFRRMKKDIPVIGITGTNGKTTTKEFLASVLSTKYKVLRNTGNLNNQIGLPLSLIRLNDTDEVVVLEMGASMPGDIKELCEIAVPRYGILTNIGYAHLEGFGDINRLRETKLELLNTVQIVSINADDSFLPEDIKGYKGRVIRYGTNSSQLDVYAKDIVLRDRGSRFLLNLWGDSIEVNLRVSGLFNIYNALGASSIAHILGISPDGIKLGLEGFTGVPMRYEVKSIDNVVILSDVYNANPASMEEALKELIRLRDNRAVAVLGDMLELGAYGETAHRRLGLWMSELPIDLFIGVGPLMSYAVDEFRGRSIKADTPEEARRILINEQKLGDTILIKGSRLMRMERVLEDAL